ncbi:hypothetical protein CK203_023953 [Vitis vinifera]|uniref:Uncharacterized protein n=1 Tax=Vitis vinifera TaxID=29760 RepID=A0A438IPP0_VITVI|nr:hypothetical protein CK203_023953 [Vitis vinifera]
MITWVLLKPVQLMKSLVALFSVHIFHFLLQIEGYLRHQNLGPKNSWMNKIFGVGVVFIYLVQVATVNLSVFSMMDV